MYKKCLVFFSLLFCICQSVSPHSSWEAHARDVMDVLGMDWNGRKSPKNVEIKQWLYFLSSKMIDDTSFHKELMIKHNKFQNIGTPRKHRILFHWGYNAEPWNTSIQQEVVTYCEQYDLNVESNIRIFKSEIKTEQIRRNKKINSETEKLFGFAHGGKDASYARFFAAIAYNVHILGDYTSDNTELTGLQPINVLIGQIVIEIRNLDKIECKSLIKGITLINKRCSNSQKKADSLLVYLKNEMPKFLKRAQGGSLCRRLTKGGVVFVNG